jgi:hypothetical protein
VKKNTYQELLLSMPTTPIQKRANKIDFISKKFKDVVENINLNSRHPYQHL